MLSKPFYGWCDVNLGNFNGKASYLTDVPMELLEKLIKHFTENELVAIKFDEEGTEFILVIDFYETYIISDRTEKPDAYYIPKTDKELAMEVIYDIEKNFDEWVNWECYAPIEEKRDLKLKLLLNQLKKILNKK